MKGKSGKARGQEGRQDRWSGASYATARSGKRATGEFSAGKGPGVGFKRITSVAVWKADDVMAQPVRVLPVALSETTHDFWYITSGCKQQLALNLNSNSFQKS